MTQLAPFARLRRSVAAVALGLAGLFVLAACGVDTFDVTSASSNVPADYQYFIHEGAGEEIDDGVPLDILPARLDARVGQTIEIVNDDSRGHLVGPWFVGGGETLRQTFTSAGEFIGECTVHPSGEIRVIISP